MKKSFSSSLILLFCLIQLLSLVNSKEFLTTTRYFRRDSSNTYNFCTSSLYYSYSSRNTHKASFSIMLDRPVSTKLDLYLYGVHIKSVNVDRSGMVTINNVDLSIVHRSLVRNDGVLLGRIKFTGHTPVKPILLKSEFYIDSRDAVRSSFRHTCFFYNLVSFYNIILIIGLFFMAFIFVVALAAIVINKMRSNSRTLRRGNQYEVIDSKSDRKVSIVKNNSSPSQSNNHTVPYPMHYPFNDTPMVPDEEIPSTPPPYVEPQTYFTPNNPMIPSYPNYIPLNKQ